MKRILAALAVLAASSFARAADRDDILLADFEGETYGIGWTTTVKKGQLVSDANARPVELQRGQEVSVNGLALDAEPQTLFVVVDDVTLEVRKALLGT